MLLKNSFMKITFKNLIKNTTILSLPGLISIIISLIAIPIHLNFAGPESYGNYIIFHFILMIAINLNLGIGKSTVISINNFPKYKKRISFKSLIYTKNISIIIILISILIFSLSYIIFPHLKLFNYFVICLIIGSITTVFFLTLEGILQGNRKFKYISILNLFFYSLSFSFPSLLLFYYQGLTLENLILISIIIKLLSVIFMFLIIGNNTYVEKSENRILLKNLKKNSRWITLNGLLIQFYDLFDKYLIKIFLGPIALASYSVPQQLTGKLSIISKSFSAFLLPNLSRKKTDNYDFYFSLNIFIKIIPIFIFLVIPLYPSVLKFWLGSAYSETILILTKIFSLSVIFSCASHILITKFEANKILNQNLKIEFILMPFFLFCLYYLTSENFSLIFISALILFKELILFFLRLYFLKKEIDKINIYYFKSLFYLIVLWLSFFNDFLFYSSLILLILTSFKNDIKQHI